MTRGAFEQAYNQTFGTVYEWKQAKGKVGPEGRVAIKLFNNTNYRNGGVFSVAVYNCNL
jgi:hypothetical protein